MMVTGIVFPVGDNFGPDERAASGARSSLYTDYNPSPRCTLSVPLAIVLANVPAEGDDNVVTGMTRMVEAESVFPEGDRSLHSVREFCRHMLDMLKTDTTGLKEAETASLSGSAAFEHSRAVERLSNIFSAISDSVQSHRAKRVRELPIDLVAADRIRTGIEEALLTPPAHVEIFHDFEIVQREHVR